MRADDNLYWHFGGYCDVDGGDECDRAYKLPYTVDFGGRKTSSLQISNDGTVRFVDDALFSDVIVLIDTGIADAGIGPDIASVGKAPYYLEEEVSKCDFPGCKSPEANYVISAPIINVAWFTCGSSDGRPGSCYGGFHTLTLSPTARGFNVKFDGGDKDDYFLAATFDPPLGVPEPGTWALLILGFGAVGSALRSRRQLRRPALGAAGRPA